VIAKTGDVIDGATLVQFFSPIGLSKNGIVVFHAVFTDSSNQRHDGMFTPDHLVASTGAPFGPEFGVKNTHYSSPQNCRP
jgi:hypothetical protein